ncbi:hypothetical protein J2752_000542 [Halarchaeum rubridurum]|uniref:DUF7969 domain-containing protein n=1 Tax=Halarchaeum rubridurum TaxID=489911 RepID=A0A830FJM7_9EURY|nr:hypothetical protein [Halarchaeum rubridurum]MBP1953661.1 hypothetical protein [Halarchaeum rubridurum]GGM53671.1 hypothetical protein GCM10009017_00030 [Halarchaeum rubridurum]
MVAVRYYCPRCETVVAVERDAYLDDKSVTPYPLTGWTYVAPDEEYEDDAVDGVRFVCGESDGCAWEPPGGAENGDGDDAGETDALGCGEPFYLNFVAYEDGEEVEAAGERESEYVELAEGRVPRGPSGPRGPGGPTNR